ncbi:MAG TPA: histidine triad nucleotide-binding protein [Candidatus Borkfalkia avistercoris]|uniref:Histidine triad nucleotide-binding protein n=1 Tax=Candidatus Borkfalkia avistercoris TaxID=2838504 RepID=A0A9D2IF43_9FIRM|nr:histidine triad nucleotide-binding protein [Candidatus Borkfalkia avistercoris]
MENCIFCKIIAGEIPSNKVYEDDDMLVFRDINPQAKVHCLCVPKSHFATLAEMDEKQAEQVKRCLVKIPGIAKALGLENGYRLIVNQGRDAGQTVFHLHIHILGGENMGEKLL